MTPLAFKDCRVIGPANEDDQKKWRNLSLAPVMVPSGNTRIEVAAFNVAVNQKIKYENDPLNNWQSPTVTASLGTGDCEDYAIVKYAGLMRVNVPCAVVVGELIAMPTNKPHAWCAAYADGRWLALDCMFDFVTPVENYTNWITNHVFDANGATLWGRTFTMNEAMGQA